MPNDNWRGSRLRYFWTLVDVDVAGRWRQLSRRPQILDAHVLCVADRPGGLLVNECGRQIAVDGVVGDSAWSGEAALVLLVRVHARVVAHADLLGGGDVQRLVGGVDDAAGETGLVDHFLASLVAGCWLCHSDILRSIRKVGD